MSSARPPTAPVIAKSPAPGSSAPADGQAARPPAPASKRRQSWRRSLAGWVAVAPYTVLLVLFAAVPVLLAVRASFVVTPVFGDPSFSLTQNYVDVLTDYRLLPAVRNVGLYLALWLPIMLFVICVISLVMDARRTRFAALTRFVAYVPGAVTGVAAAFLWLFMFSPSVSPIRPLLRLFFGSEQVIINNRTLVIILVVMAIAMGAGGWIVVLYGALTSISPEIIEAARIDGANAWHIATKVKLPMVRKYLSFILIVSIAHGVQVFVEPEVLAAGAPGQISNVWSVNQLVYRYATGEGNFGRASALSMLLLILSIAVAIVIIRRTRFYEAGEH